MMPLHPMELFDGRRITGCVFGDFKGKSQLPDIVDKCLSGVYMLYSKIDFPLSTTFSPFIIYLSPLRGKLW
jgi:Zn-dependent alcohol dehydrogenase